jgi:uncharacterized RDD family membrane protein YckC
MDYQPQPPVSTDLFQTEPVIYAGFWERFGAAIIDGIIVAMANYIILFLLGRTVSNITGIVIAWLYGALQESGPNQATIGKKAVGMKVTNMEGERISFAQATGRHFAKYISAIILLIGYFMMIWDEKSQTLHDKMANTLVVKG